MLGFFYLACLNTILVHCLYAKKVFSFSFLIIEIDNFNLYSSVTGY